MSADFFRGIPGPKGDRGIPGPIGPVGPEGRRGPIGPKGIDGHIGTQGPKGDTGAKGDKGDTGAKGDTGDTGATGPQGPAGGAIKVVATENLPAFSAVTSTGKVGNSNTIGQREKIIGVTPAAIASGFEGDVTPLGEVQNLAWAWTVGDIIFLNGTALSTTAPGAGFAQKIGTAKNSSTIYVELGLPVLL